MKYSNYIIYTVIILSACNLAHDLDDFEPQYVTSSEVVVTDQQSAEVVLTGVYSGFTQKSFQPSPYPYIATVQARLGLTGKEGFFPDEDMKLFDVNNPSIESSTLQTRLYSGPYNQINAANWLLQGLESVPDEEFDPVSRKKEMIAEARAIRAINHFYLLRLFGQFYDVSSAYGIVLRESPSIGNASSPRASVAEVYTSIHEDLDYAISNAPDLIEKWYINKTFAKALQAKVYLYQGNYSEAATLANEIISAGNPDFALSPTYAEIFDSTTDNIFRTPEVLFCIWTDGSNVDTGIGNFWYLDTVLSSDYISLLETGTITLSSNGQTLTLAGTDRVTETIGTDLFGLGVTPHGKFDLSFLGLYSTYYHFRMSEVYLIHAEAAARANGSSVPAEALVSLNAVRARAGAVPNDGSDGFQEYPASITYDEFLEAVRLEKLIELGGENGEDYFDLVRYDYADGGFSSGWAASNAKATMTNPSRFIMPIPQAFVDVSNGVVEQNPEY